MGPASMRVRPGGVIVRLVIVVALALTLAACGNRQRARNQQQPTATTAVQQGAQPQPTAGAAETTPPAAPAATANATQPQATGRAAGAPEGAAGAAGEAASGGLSQLGGDTGPQAAQIQGAGPGVNGSGVRALGKGGAKNPNVASIKIVQDSGARPRFAPDSKTFVFDRKNGDGFWDVYISDLNGNIVQSLTEGKAGIGQRTNGNAIYHPSGKYIVFLSEVPQHWLTILKGLTDPGIGLFSNLWATDLTGGQFWQLTNIPIKQNIRDKTPVFASVNPVFNSDGSMLVWTERYDNSGAKNWGKWRLKAADFVVANGVPALKNERVLYTPSKGNYVTAMRFLGSNKLVVAGNLNGQDEFGMDQYALDLGSKQAQDLTNTPDLWEEGSSATPNGKIIYMSNQDSRYKLDVNDRNWAKQPIEREWYIMNSDGTGKQRLTYFNDPSAPEYVGKRVLAVNMDASPDGKYVVGTIGIDPSSDNQRGNVQLKVVLLEFKTPEK